MTRQRAAILWSAVFLASLLHLAWGLREGLPVRSDLLALIPVEDRDPLGELARQRLGSLLSQRVVFLVGHTDTRMSIAEARRFSAALVSSGAFSEIRTGPAKGDIGKLLAAYAEHRSGLLSDADRADLQRGDVERIENNALGQVFGGFSPITGPMLKEDPFVLLPAFLAGLPQPYAHMRLVDGALTSKQGDMTWTLVFGRVGADPFAMEVQERVIEAISAAEAQLGRDTRMLRSGAVFYAEAGTASALAEMGWISVVEALGVILLLVGVFRSFGPLGMNVLAMISGISVASSFVLIAFGDLHVVTLLMGTSLIGVSVDYGIHYCCERFAPGRNADARLHRILPALILGLGTTLLGYACLLIAPLPGLRELAVFTVVGLMGAFLSVVLWFPSLDRAQPAEHGERLLKLAGRLADIWSSRAFRTATLVSLPLLIVVGLLRLDVVDDVRGMQQRDADLFQQEQAIHELTGGGQEALFLLVTAADDEGALQRTEAMSATLDSLAAQGRIAAWLAPARWVPSKARQQADRDLIEQHLAGEVLKTQLARYGLQWEPAAPKDPLELAALDGFPQVTDLVLAPGSHLVIVSGIRDSAVAGEISAGFEGVRVIDPVAQISDVLRHYRLRALWITGIIVSLLVPILLWRYGFAGGLTVMMPPLLALVCGPALAGLLGIPFTVFSALALILVLSIGVDYTIFLRESSADHRDVTLLAVCLAGLTTILSFGLLIFSSLPPVKGFGAVMLGGTVVAIALTPFAGRKQG